MSSLSGTEDVASQRKKNIASNDKSLLEPKIIARRVPPSNDFFANGCWSHAFWGFLPTQVIFCQRGKIVGRDYKSLVENRW